MHTQQTKNNQWDRSQFLVVNAMNLNIDIGIAINITHQLQYIWHLNSKIRMKKSIMIWFSEANDK